MNSRRVGFILTLVIITILAIIMKVTGLSDTLSIGSFVDPIVACTFLTLYALVVVLGTTPAIEPLEREE